MQSNWNNIGSTPFISLSAASTSRGIMIVKNGDADGLYLFDPDTKEWNNIHQDANIYNSIAQNFIIYNKTNNLILIINELNTIKFNPSNNMNESVENTIQDELYSNFIIFNNEIHSIASSESNTHKVIADDFKTESLIETDDVFLNFEDGINGCATLNMSNYIMLIGGMANGQFLNSMYKFDGGTWTKMNIVLPTGLSNFGCIATRNKSYILIFGGITERGLTDTIYIYYPRLNIFVVSKIKCPAPGKTKCVISSDEKNEELLTHGYIRDAFQRDEFKQIQILPVYLIHLIDSYWSDERVDLFVGGQNYTINLHSLFCNKIFMDIPSTVSYEMREKQEFIDAWLPRKHRQIFRDEPAEHLHDGYCERVGKFFGCLKCDRIFKSDAMCRQHFYRKHMKRDTKENPVDGKFFIWNYIPIHNKLCVYCIVCAAMRVCSIFESGTACMQHARTAHPSIYAQLL